MLVELNAITREMKIEGGFGQVSWASFGQVLGRFWAGFGQVLAVIFVCPIACLDVQLSNCCTADFAHSQETKKKKKNQTCGA
ncbi:uncharacterized protein YALI1_B11719g [Yarrowia lipolytica]|uniref:Uncharacterized protein n=1 Tax=Yarrowia lipolytica TaxID=4952 RepID=A0A1D8N706_YARLL|nr:hypothetical protein YALI1_B11719g [Yarrowia lipolytica]